MSAAL